MCNFISCVRLGISDNGLYQIGIFSKRKEIKTFDFANMNVANLFVGYCVYPFINQNLGIFHNATCEQESYFFDKEHQSNVNPQIKGNYHGFISMGHKNVLHKQRFQMAKNILYAMAKKCKIK